MNLLLSEIISYNPFTILVLGFSLLFLFSLFILLAVLIVNDRPKIPDVKQIKDKAYDDALQILDQARVKSLSILSDSQIKAQESLDTVEDLNESTKAQLTNKLKEIYTNQSKVLEKSGIDLIESYKKALEDEKREHIKTIGDTTAALKKELVEEVSDFKDSLKKETFESQQEIESKIKQSYTEVEKEIEDYKHKKIEELNSDILNVLSRIASKVFGHTLDQVEHEKFILDTVAEELRKSGLRR